MEAAWRTRSAARSSADDFDHQLINIDLTLTTAEGKIANLTDRVSEASGRLEIADEDF